MAEKRMFIINEKTLRRIDASRGGYSRAEFVEICVDRCFGSGGLGMNLRREWGRAETSGRSPAREHRYTARNTISVSPGVIARIDACRGDLNRAEFVELCLDNCVSNDYPSATTRRTGDEDCASLEEFREFKHGVSNFLRMLLDIFINTGASPDHERVAHPARHRAPRREDIPPEGSIPPRTYDRTAGSEWPADEQHGPDRESPRSTYERTSSRDYDEATLYRRQAGREISYATEREAWDKEPTGGAKPFSGDRKSVV